MDVNTAIILTGCATLVIGGLGFFSAGAIFNIFYAQHGLNLASWVLTLCLFIFGWFYIGCGIGIFLLKRAARLLLTEKFLLVVVLLLTVLAIKEGSTIFLLCSVTLVPVFLYYIFSLWFFRQPQVEEFFAKEKTLEWTTPEGEEIKAPLVERRRAKRYAGNDRVKYRLISDPSVQGETISLDVSKLGMKLQFGKEIPVGSLIDLTVTLKEDSRPIYAIAQVAWIRKLDSGSAPAPPIFEMGVKFIEIDPSDRLRLVNKYVYDSFKRH